MKIGILTQYYPPEIGAPQARLSDLARRFVAAGHQVFVLTAMPNYPRGRIYPGYGGFFCREEREGVSVVRTYIYPTKSLGMGRRLLSYFSFVFSSLVVGLVALPKLDYLITESPPLFLGITGYFLSRLKRAHWVFNVSDLWPEGAVRLGVLRDGWRLRGARALEAWCYRKAWLVTGQSKEILQDITSRFPEVFTYHLPNGVDTNLFHPEHRSQSARRQLSDTEACIIIYAGLHGLAQGLGQILEAAAQLKNRCTCLFVLVGDGPEKERLVERGRLLGLTNVRFLDPYPHDAMPALLASADIAIVTLKDKIPGSVPSKIYEAMGAGIPVVLVAEGEAAAIVRDAKAGIVVSPGEVNTLTSVLLDLSKDEEKRRQLGAWGRQAAVSHFDRQNIASNFIRLLEGHTRC